MTIKNKDIFSLLGFRGFIGIGRAEFEWPSLARKHHALTVTAMTFQAEKSDQPFVLLAADLPLLSAEGEGFILASLAGALGIPLQNFLLNVSYASLSTDSSAGMPDNADDVVHPFLDAIEKAQLRMRIGSLEVASTPCSLALGESRPWENVLTLGRIVDGMGQVQGTLVNYSCLPGKTDLPSPGFVGQMRQVVETLIGGTCVFVQGPPRGASPRLHTLPESNLADRNTLDRFGVAMGHTVYANLMGLFPATDLATDYPENVTMRSRLVGWEVGNVPFYSLAEPTNFHVSPMILVGKPCDVPAVAPVPSKSAVAI
jgi:hypothetical protein